MGYDDAFALCITVIATLPTWVLRTSNKKRGEIVAQVLDPMGGFGQLVRLKLLSAGKRVTLHLSSRSRQPMLIFDYGSNERNLDQLMTRLADRVRGSSPS